MKNEESLGQKMIDGVFADGKRVTTVLPAGSIGNQQPITVLSEQWFAPDLEILVMTKHSDPRTGETIYSLSNITRGEPAANLFDVPADYTIQDSSYIRTPAVSIARPSSDSHLSKSITGDRALTDAGLHGSWPRSAKAGSWCTSSASSRIQFSGS